MRKPAQSKISPKPSLFIASVLGIAFSLISFTVIIFLGLPARDLNTDLNREQTMSTSSQASQSLIGGESVESAASEEGRGLPIRLKIPKINVDAPVKQVGLTSAGDVGVPIGPDTAGWFKLSPLPGEKGSSIIDGHFGWKDGTPAIFDNLHQLVRGDNIYVQNDRGEIISFVVVDTQSYDPNANAAEVFGSRDSKAHLNLITCEGVWDKAEKSYTKRLIVFADKEIE